MTLRGGSVSAADSFDVKVFCFARRGEVQPSILSANLVGRRLNAAADVLAAPRKIPPRAEAAAVYFLSVLRAPYAVRRN